MLNNRKVPICEGARPDLAVSREEAEAAVRTLIQWAGDDPSRPGLIDTPARVVKSYEEFFAGYLQSPHDHLDIFFQDERMAAYDDMIIVRDIEVNSTCEHHMVPMSGVAHVAYVPDEKVTGLSKIARLVDVFARRLQVQEALSVQIADALYVGVDAKGVAISMTLRHDCMCRRGVAKSNSLTTTLYMNGCFKQDPDYRDRFVALIK